jgi:adenosine deaminase
LVQLAKNSFTGSFLSEKEKVQWITKIDRVVSSLGGGSSS